MKVGVVIGRFQNNFIHPGHAMLINYVKEQCDLMLIVIGEAKAQSVRNPLSFEVRKLMFESTYKKSFNYKVLKLADYKYDSSWVASLDYLIAGNIEDANEVILYTGRDGFSKVYSGVFKVTEIDFGLQHLSARDNRDYISKTIQDSKEWREGIIYATANKFPVSYQTVDIAVLDEFNKRVLLGKKTGEKNYRFIGGFVDPADESLEYAAKRETLEEVKGIEVDNFKYLASIRIDDWRYRNSQDKIMTAFFTCSYIFGRPGAADDISEISWINYADLESTEVEPEHKELKQILISKLKTT